jgi:nickel-dependent lactate racemase
MKVKVDYGKTGLEIEIPDSMKVQIAKPQPIEPLADPINEIKKSLSKPDIGTPLSNIIRSKKQGYVCIVISDSTRPVPSGQILEALIQELLSLGVSDSDVKILIATGLHRKTTNQELQTILPKWIIDRFDIINHEGDNPKTLEYIDKTSFGTPIYINKVYLNAAVKIITGYVEPHFFAGFSGGRKAICPGIVGLETILANHSAKNIANPNSRFGILKDNPISDDAIEISKHPKIKPDFVVNVTINSEHKIDKVASGNLGIHSILVKHQERVAMCDLDRPFDIVICNNGGYPLDLNLYQAVKSMALGALAVKKGGTIITTNELRDGVGQPDFEELLKMPYSPKEINDKLVSGEMKVRDQWQIQFLCMVLMHAEVIVASPNISKEKLGSLGLIHAKSVEEALAYAEKKHGKDASVLVLPNGPQIVPKLCF